MQTFSKMRRDSAFKTFLDYFFVFAFFAFYVFLTDIYVFFSPMLGVLFLCFCSFWREKKCYRFFLILACLFWIELCKNLAFGSLFIYFFTFYAVFYLPFFYFFTKTIWMKVVQIAVIYCGFGILYCVFFSSGYIDFWNLVFLLLLYIFVEGVVVLAYEFKN